MKNVFVLLLALCVAASISFAQEKAPKAKPEKAKTMDCCKPGKDVKASAEDCEGVDCSKDETSSKDACHEGKTAMKGKEKGGEKGKMKEKMKEKAKETPKEKSKDAKES